MRIAAVADVHGEEFKEPFLEGLEKTRDVDLFLIAGDLTDRSDIQIFRSIFSTIEETLDCPVVCVFGNEEYDQDRAAMREGFDSTFLDDERAEIRIKGIDITIVGSTGCLDRPTWWQRTNIAGIFEKYSRRISLIDEMLPTNGYSILLLHYPPTYETLRGEKERYWPEMGSRKLERVVLQKRPNLIFHGHAHQGLPFVELKSRQLTLFDYEGERTAIPVRNVAFPLVQRITVIETGALPTS